MNIYIWMLIIIVGLGIIMEGSRAKNKSYIVLIGIMLFGICALRGIRVGADLGRYQVHYNFCVESTWSEIFEQYKLQNIVFYGLCKIHSQIFGNSFHGFLLILAVFEGICLMYFIYKVSVNPYMSYLMYVAMGYYIFVYSGLKQALATAFVILAFMAVIDRKLSKFIIFMIIAGFIHMPALIFLPAYYLGSIKPKSKYLIYLIPAAIIMYMFKGHIVFMMNDVYESVVSDTAAGGVGGKVIMMLFLIVLGILFRYPDGENKVYSACFNLMIVATLIQVFAVYGNVFERLADYYFIFVIIYIPMVFEKAEDRKGSVLGYVNYDYNIYAWVNMGVFVFSVIYYYMMVSSTYGLLPYTLYFGGE